MSFLYCASQVSAAMVRRSCGAPAGIIVSLRTLMSSTATLCVQACVNAAKECGDTYKKCREAFEAKERWRKQLIDSLVEREQKAAFKQVFASPADVAEYCADAKKAKVYGKKFAKFEKSIRKAWAKSPDLKDPYVLPDAGAVDALVDRWRGPGA